jgi:tight adherence protein B
MGLMSLGGIAFAIFFPKIQERSKANKRLSRVTDKTKAGGREKLSADDNVSRRKQVQESLKEIEEKQKAKKIKLTLRMRIQQAGLNLAPRSFYVFSFAAAIAVTGVLAVTGNQPLVLLGAFAATSLGFPRWVLSFLTKRRQAKFLTEFANSIDIIVRGVKSGLPLNDCLNIIAKESPEPVGPEFAEIVDAQRAGIPLNKCLENMFERIPLAEVNFFVIVLSIQQQSGGNLSEALGNLSKVLRERKKMLGKIQAMSQEAKSSAAIIGFLPFGIMGAVYATSPDYISILWTDPTGNVLLAGSAVWMLTGVMVMKKMIAFDF